MKSDINTFLGRASELGRLHELLDKKTASLVVVRGRRRIGKSRLIREFSKQVSATYYGFSGLAPEDRITAQDQRNEFTLQLSQQTELPEVKLDDWTKCFMLLADKAKTGRVIILLDEITWMATGDATFLSKLKNAWDLYFSQNTQLILILCGSVSAWIEKNIMNSTGFFGRVSLELVLRELSLIHGNALLETLGFQRSLYEKLLYLSLTGCIPWYLEQINPKISAARNIQHLCFVPNALMIKEFERVFNDLFGRRGDIYRKIVHTLAFENKDYSELSEAISYPKGSALTDYLSELISSGYIRQYYQWNLKTNKTGKLSQYRLSDNYLRFYFRFLLPKMEMIQKGRYENIDIVQLPGWKTVLGLQFENLILNNRDFIFRELRLRPEEIIADDPYFQRATKQQKGCQIDYLIQTQAQTCFVCEIKFLKGMVSTDIIAQMQQKIAALSLPRGFAALPVLIYFGDLSEESPLHEYFYKVISVENLVFPES